VEALFLVAAELTAAWRLPSFATAPDAAWKAPRQRTPFVLRWRTMDGSNHEMLFTVGSPSLFRFLDPGGSRPLSTGQSHLRSPSRQALTSTKTYGSTRAERGPGTKGRDISIATAPRNHAPPVGARTSALLTSPSR